MGGRGLQGEQSDKVGELCGIAELGEVMRNKRIRWAASVYGRHLSELSGVAEKILREVVEEDMELQGMRRRKRERNRK